MSKMGGICLNWKVLAGLAVVGLAVWVVAPGLMWAALPLLIVAACPLSMLLMMRGMQRSHCSSQPTQVSRPSDDARTRDEQLAALEAQLAGLRAQQETIASALAELQAASMPAVREAEAVARAAEERAQRPS